MKDRAKKAVNQKDFEDIKQMLGFGIKARQIHEITGRSVAVIGFIKHSTSLNEYKVKMRTFNDKYRKPVKVNIPVENESSVSTPQLISILNDITETLNNIDSRLEFIENNIVVAPRRKLFK